MMRDRYMPRLLVPCIHVLRDTANGDFLGRLEAKVISFRARHYQ